MRKVLFLGFMLMLTSSIFLLTSCDDDDPIVATCTDGIQNGNETGIDCGGECDACEVGVHGSWESDGTNISPLLAPYFTNLVVEFKTDGTYVLDQTDVNDAVTQATGTFIQTESSVSGIWDITLNQASPALTVEGIFQITGNQMQYEVVQTDPATAGVTPPTAAAGFGSTSAGAFGDTNIQVFVRL